MREQRVQWLRHTVYRDHYLCKIKVGLGPAEIALNVFPAHSTRTRDGFNHAKQMKPLQEAVQPGRVAASVRV